MSSFKQKINTLKSPYHYMTYCCTWVGFGCLMSGTGPIIPYMAQLSGNPQTQYSFLFLCRSIGFLVGALFLRYLQQKFTFHQIATISSIGTFLMMTMFAVITNLYWQGVFMFILSNFSCFFCVIINMSILNTQKHGDIQFWMLIAHGLYGFGGLLGPYIVYLFQQYSFIVIGVMIGLLSIPYGILKTPQNHQQVQEEARKSAPLQELKKVGQYIAQSTQHKQTFPANLQLLVCIMYLLYVGMQVSFASWISTYSVLQKISTKEQATRYSSLFWFSLTIFRFIVSCVTLGSVNKIRLLICSMVISTLSTIIMIYSGYSLMACYFSAMSFGFCLSGVYPLLFSVPTEYGYELTGKQTSGFMFWTAVGEGSTATLIGYLMQWFTNNSLFFMMFLMAVIFLIMIEIFKIKIYYQNPLEQTEQTAIQLQERLNGDEKIIKEKLII